MPEIFRKEGFVVSFYSSDGHEPIHVHVRKAGGEAKIWVEPIHIEYGKRMEWQDLKRAEELVAENIDLIKMRWHEYFGN